MGHGHWHALCAPVSWGIARFWFGALNAIALLGVSGWAFAIGKRHSLTCGVFCVGAVLACAPVAICLSYGQYSLMVLAAIILGLVCLERGRNVAAGLALGIACVKPHLAALPLLAIALKGHFVPLLIASVVVVATSMVPWAFTGIDPITWFMEAQLDARKFVGISVNPLTELLLPMLGFDTTMLVLGVTGVVITIGMVWGRNVKLPRDVTVAMAVVVSMFVSYRRPYDVPLLALPMLVLFEAAAASRSWAYWAAAGAFGATLWIPFRNEQWSWPWVQTFHSVVWVGCALLLFYTKRSSGVRLETGNEEARDEVAVESHR